jgi:uncharacterized protein (TIGR02145 family)/uncharacterized repeat protein (TIGR02543 family)
MLASLPTPTRGGYTFNGWFTSTTGGSQVTTSTAFSANATIYAQWTLVTYTITFNANNGTVNPTSGTTGDGWKLTSLPTPTRTGYTFNGWYTGATSGTVVNTNTVFNANTTIYAQWTLITYTITFDANGGTVNPTIGTTGAGGTLASLPTPTRTGCTFNGWYATVTGKTQVTTSTVFNANATIYAQWNWIGKGNNINNYKTIVIGSQKWMAENLDYDVAGSKCYDNDPANCEKYGRLYNWNDAMSACPTGWHLPLDADWTKLFVYVGGSGIAGKKLKSTTGWYSNYGTDEYGFSALPGGNGLYFGGSTYTFSSVGTSGSWWRARATEWDASTGVTVVMLDTSDEIWKTSPYLASVRCVAD